MNEEKILIVEDEKELGELVRDYLQVEGYEAILTYDGEEGLAQFYKEKPIMAVLDIMLPNIDGIEVCRRIRKESNIPILMMSAKKSDTDKIIGLGIGADDYMTKPFSPGELVARIKAHLRRYKHFSNNKEQTYDHIIEFRNLKLDVKRYELYVNEERINVSATEFKLLHLLLSHKGQVFSKEQLYEKVWGYTDYGDINTVTVYMSKIRDKIEADTTKPQYIQTVWGVGYKFNDSL
ncbi:response regulator [Pontibacillus yanchengensis]|uniref:Response regulator n=2 Tax=Pontibacillus yanchengensis TaxID=462910 RepID=A0ACC7VCQ4_9BACI|nr:response regulator transcription factor [Pontibacillus yanchengensis]MYL32168.1 response regulator [Pontibacillus yanchengensis]MYL52748.1 response regulator [Pontibacillus yanchengensis]